MDSIYRITRRRPLWGSNYPIGSVSGAGSSVTITPPPPPPPGTVGEFLFNLSIQSALLVLLEDI